MEGSISPFQKTSTPSNFSDEWPYDCLTLLGMILTHFKMLNTEESRTK